MISVSFLKSKFSKKETLERISNSNADYLHVDLMDGDIEAYNVESKSVGRGALTKVFIPYYDREA